MKRIIALAAVTLTVGCIGLTGCEFHIGAGCGDIPIHGLSNFNDLKPPRPSIQQQDSTNLASTSKQASQ